jgi:hypothetical protein|nr:MAG TPA: hypothetical protein [Caudoviricetes sp.]
MKVKNLLPILFNVEKVRIYMADADVDLCGYAYSIPKKYYNYKIDKVCSFSCEYSDSCTYIFIK